MSRASVRQFAAHRQANGLPPVVPQSPDVNGSWRRPARTRPVESVSAPETGSDSSEAPKAAQRVSTAPLRPVSKAQPDDDRLAVTLTVAALRELVRDVALEVLAEGDNAPPALLDRSGLARALGVGLSMVDRLRREGMPCVLIGDSPRFVLGEALAWVCEHRRSARSAEGGQP